MGYWDGYGYVDSYGGVTMLEWCNKDSSGGAGNMEMMVVAQICRR